jgi:hypothetical protein
VDGVIFDSRFMIQDKAIGKWRMANSPLPMDDRSSWKVGDSRFTGREIERDLKTYTFVEGCKIPL